MHAVTTQQFLHGDCIDFSLVLSRCMHAGLRHIAHAMQNSAGSEIQRNRTRSGQYEYSCTGTRVYEYRTSSGFSDNLESDLIRALWHRLYSSTGTGTRVY